MTIMQIDTSREARLWTCTILSSVALAHGFLYSMSDEYRTWIRDASNKLFRKITKSA